MVTTEIGRAAESLVEEELKRRGFKVLDRNWRMKSCEIDIVARKANAIYFVEVKYRKSSAQGDGFDYITQPKLKRMRFAASMWIQFNSWDGDFRLLAASVDGSLGEIDIIEID